MCNTQQPNAQKLKFATDRRIPAVHATWLWDCLRYGQLQPYTKYQLNTIEPSRPQKSRSKPEAAADAPTAKLSTEESFELIQKKANAKKSRAKSGAQQPRTLDLALSADPTPSTASNSLSRADEGTNYSDPDRDEPSIPGLDGAASLPLQDISANSPRRPSTTSADSKPQSRERSSSAESLIRPIPAKGKTKPAKEPSPDSVIPAGAEEPAPAPQPGVPEEKDYSDILAQLRANRKVLPSPADANPSNRRRGRRQLGRATSTRSNDSTAAEGSGQQLNLDGDDDKEQAVEYQPSQELGWDSPGAVKARETMIKRLGGTLTEKSVRVEGIGVVRDVASEGAGGRVPRKRRDRGF